MCSEQKCYIHFENINNVLCARGVQYVSVSIYCPFLFDGIQSLFEITWLKALRTQCAYQPYSVLLSACVRFIRRRNNG